MARPSGTAESACVEAPPQVAAVLAQAHLDSTKAPCLTAAWPQMAYEHQHLLHASLFDVKECVRRSGAGMMGVNGDWARVWPLGRQAVVDHLQWQGIGADRRRTNSPPCCSARPCVTLAAGPAAAQGRRSGAGQVQHGRVGLFTGPLHRQRLRGGAQPLPAGLLHRRLQRGHCSRCASVLPRIASQCSAATL